MSAEKTAITGFPSDSSPHRGGGIPPAVWLGPGPLFRDLASVLRVLQGEAHEPLEIEDLPDLDRLFDPPPGSGQLLLAAESLPTEDIGLVRRFLRRQSGWTLVLCGGDPRHSTVRSLSIEGRARWLAWPPDLDQMRTLAGAEGGNGQLPHFDSAEGVSAGSVSAGSATPSPDTPQPGRESGLKADTGANRAGELDLGELLEELLATAALAEAPPRYVYAATGDLRCPLDASQASTVLEAVLGLAAAAAGEGAQVNVQARVAGRGTDRRVEVEVSFPEGPLSGVEPEDVLDPEVVASEVGLDVGAELDGASTALARLGGEATVERPSAGQLLLTVAFPAG